MKVVIEFDSGQLDENQVVYLILDAFSEFQSHRGPTAEIYVEQRYNPHSYVIDRVGKVRQVRERVKVAEALRSGITIIRHEAVIDFGISDSEWDFQRGGLHTDIRYVSRPFEPVDA